MAPTPRPGGRTASVRSAVLDATSALLVEHGLEGVQLSAVSDRAGVAKSTVYRRWGSVPALVSDLLTDMAESSLACPSAGSFRDDLRWVAQLVRRTLANRRQGRLFKAIIAAATCDSHTAAALAGFYRARIAALSPIVADAIRNGEAPPGTEPAQVLRQLSAPLYFQFLTDTKALTLADAERAVDVVLAAVAAGVFVRGTS